MKVKLEVSRHFGRSLTGGGRDEIVKALVMILRYKENKAR